jgi:DDE_Tnp_1-associated
LKWSRKGGAETFVDIARFGEKKLDLPAPVPAFRDGTPSHDHLGDIFATLDAEAFQRCFVSWVAALSGAPADVIAIDGKTLAPLLPEERRQGPDPHGFGLRGASALGARTGQGGGQVERDRRHPGAARYDGHRGGQSCPSTRWAANAASLRK